MEPISQSKGAGDSTELRQDIIEACLWMNEAGINQGTSGNISVRVGERMLITPSGVPYSAMRPEMIQAVPLDRAPEVEGPLRPSTEWQFHQALLQRRPEMSAVVHAHPAYATALAVQRRSIPACHYMVAVFGGSEVPLADYDLFGSVGLADKVVAAMSGHSGCLMANHGAIVLGETLAKALWRMEELENLARVYHLALQAGKPVLLSDREMSEALAAIGAYGLKDG